jgi:hypothetical protein
VELKKKYRDSGETFSRNITEKSHFSDWHENFYLYHTFTEQNSCLLILKTFFCMCYTSKFVSNKKAMKNFKIKFLGLALVGLILGACSQMGTYENADLMNEQAEANKAGFTMSPFGMGNENAKTSTSGNLTLTYEDVVCLGNPSIATFGGAGFTGKRTVQIQKLVGSEWVQVFQKSQATSGTTANLGVLPVGEHTFRWTVGGQDGAQNVVFTISVEQCSDCVASFSYVDNGDDAPYTFKYTPSEDMTDVLVEFTFAQGVAVTGLDGFTQNGGGNSSVWSDTRSFVACTEYTFTVDLSADCSGNSGNSSVWTDFKVAGLSKKNSETPTITESCPN